MFVSFSSDLLFIFLLVAVIVCFLCFKLKLLAIITELFDENTLSLGTLSNVVMS